MRTQHERPWPAIDLVELRYCLAFGSSVEEMADLLHRDVEDVRHKTVETQERQAYGRTRFSEEGLQPGLDALGDRARPQLGRVSFSGICSFQDALSHNDRETFV
jgi:hypothetical protein